MPIIFKNISFLLLLMVAFSAMCVQAAEIPMRGPIPFEAFDKDGNKMISPQEFVETHNLRKKMLSDANMRPRRMQRSFTDFDTNGDNKISPDELNAGKGDCMGYQRNMPPPGPYGQRPMGMGRDMNQQRQMPSFTDFDLNKDGVLTKDEFYQAREQRMRQRTEQGHMMRNVVNAPPFEILDTNRDGKVTQQEFSAHQAMRQQMRREL